MRPGTKITLLFTVLTMVVACTGREAEARKVKENADAKARAEAARKEMDTLPKTFRSRDIFKKNEPEKQAVPAAVEQPAIK